MVTFWSLSAASLNMRRSQNGILGNGLNFHHTKLWTKSKAFADNNLDRTKINEIVSDREEDTEVKGEILASSIFAFSHHVFKSFHSQGHLTPICVAKLLQS